MAKAKPTYYAPSTEATGKELAGRRIPDYGNYEIWVPQDGDNTIRILPAWRKDGPLFKILHIHWFGDRDNKKAVLCLKRFGKRCFICEEISKLLANGVLDNDSAKQYYPSRRAFCNGLDMDNPELGVQIMALPAQKVAGEINKWLEKKDYKDFWHPEVGRNIIITRDSSGQFPTYSVLPAGNSTSIPDFNVLNNLYDLDDFETVWKVIPYDEMKQMWLVYSDIVKPVDDVEPEVETSKDVEKILDEETEGALDVENLLS